MSKHLKRGIVVAALILAVLAGLLAYDLRLRKYVETFFAGSASGWTLANNMSDCKLPAGTLAEDDPRLYSWQASYADCLLALKPGKRTVVVIAMERDKPNTYDAFGAVNIVLDFPEEKLVQGISLPDPEVKVAYSGCWGAWIKNGCEVGNGARGRVHFLPWDEKAVEVDIDLAMDGRILGNAASKWGETIPALLDLPRGWIPYRVTGTAQLSKLKVTGEGQARLLKSGSRTLDEELRR